MKEFFLPLWGGLGVLLQDANTSKRERKIKVQVKSLRLIMINLPYNGLKTYSNDSYFPTDKLYKHNRF